MEPYSSLIDAIIDREGGYVDRASDRGGPTCWGITERVARSYGYAGPMSVLPATVARKIYEQRYWFEPAFDLVHSRVPALGMELLDTGVNQGPETAGKFLQIALNAFNQRGRSYPDVAVDGQIGPMTLDALDAFLAARGAQGVRVLMAALNSQQGALYLKLATNDATQEDYVYGWILNRVVS